MSPGDTDKLKKYLKTLILSHTLLTIKGECNLYIFPNVILFRNTMTHPEMFVTELDE